MTGSEPQQHDLALEAPRPLAQAVEAAAQRAGGTVDGTGHGRNIARGAGRAAGGED